MEANKILENYKSGYNDLQNALREFPFEMWDFKPAQDKWSIKEIIVHITDSEINGYIRFRKAIAEKGTEITAYDQDAWAEQLHYSSRSIDTNLELFRLLRVLNYSLLISIPDDKWINSIKHPEIGNVNVHELLKIYADHVPVHIKQMKKIYEEWINLK
jgi:hypothetical protein